MKKCDERGWLLLDRLFECVSWVQHDGPTFFGARLLEFSGILDLHSQAMRWRMEELWRRSLRR